MRRTLQQFNICYDTDHIEKENTPITRMHSSRMRTARSLTVPPYLVVSHARPPRSNHASPPEQPCMPPRATMHPPGSNHACPPGVNTHPPWEQPHMPPQATTHAPLGNHTCPPRATMHAPPVDRQTPVKT